MSKWMNYRWLIVTAVVIGFDQFTKSLAVGYLDFGFPFEIFTLLNFTLAYNTGAAFSFLSNASGWQQSFFVLIAALISVVLLVWLYRLPKNDKWNSLAIALILAGALGNVWDRITLGYVIDFIDFHITTWHWPAFNIADSAITIGAVMLLLDVFQVKSHQQV